MAVLEVTTPNGEKQVVPIRKCPFTIGRSPENELILDDKSSSRRHSQIILDADRHIIRDLGSANRTLVNGLIITSPHELKNRDKIMIGDTTLIYKHEPAVTEGSTVIAPVGRETTEISHIIKSADEVQKEFDRHSSKFVTHKEDIDQGYKQFYTLYQLGKIVNSASNIDELLSTAMKLIFKVLRADRGIIMQLDMENKRLVPRITKARKEVAVSGPIAISSTITSKVVKEKVSILTADALSDPRFMDGRSIAAMSIRSALCVPLCDDTGVVRGIIYVDNLSESNLFSENDLNLLTAVANQIAIGIRKDELNAKIKMEAVIRSTLEKYNSREVVDMMIKQIEKGGEFSLDVREAEATVIFADLVSFTPLCEELAPSDLARRLSRYFSEMSKVIFEHKGMINKYVGDAILAVFGAFSEDNGAYQATLAAKEMLKSLHHLQKNETGFDRFRVRIGVNTGTIVTGNIGPIERIEYTVLGDPVNVAARLQVLAKPDTAVIGEETFAHIKGKVQTRYLGRTKLKGKTEKLKCYQVI